MLPDLPERFLPPKGWRTDSFVNPETGHTIHYAFALPQRDAPSAIIVCLGGLSEFSEKYYEVAHDMLDRGYAFWFIDWAYQGHSSRLTKFPQRRHSDGFETDVSDLHKLITDHIKPSTVPLIMLGHSMGGNIGLNYLAQYKDHFSAAAFTAPLLGIHKFGPALRFVACIIRMLGPLTARSYVFGGKDWVEASRKSDGTDIFSSDPLRDTLHNIWSKSDSTLQVGNVTFQWVIKALQSCNALLNGKIRTINIPVLIALAGEEQIVDNECIRKAARLLPKGQLIEITGARHEILMERDAFRNQFLNAFDKMVEVNKIAKPENTKPD